jgi:hypothetical protein
LSLFYNVILKNLGRVFLETATRGFHGLRPNGDLANCHILIYCTKTTTYFDPRRGKDVKVRPFCLTKSTDKVRCCLVTLNCVSVFWFNFVYLSTIAMPKIKPPIEEYIKNFPELKFENNKIFCRACIKTVSLPYKNLFR